MSTPNTDRQSGILSSVKANLSPGLSETETAFDDAIIFQINVALAFLYQLGIGPDNGYKITGATEQWSDFLPEGDNRFNLSKNYVMIKTKLMFDPPANSFLVEMYNKELKEIEWRLKILHDEVLEEESQNE